MSDDFTLIDLSKLSEPATVLIKKISNAVGTLYEPHHIKRIAKAEAEAEKTKVLSKIELDELQRRAFMRFVSEETRKQVNIESITAKSIGDLEDDAKPEEMEDDWISNFFDKCKLISDEEMQSLWGRVLAGEANKPGTYSKRTINFISSIDKSDAMLFSNFCSFCWFSGSVMPLVYDLNHEIYSTNKINYMTLKHLEDIGLISLADLTQFITQGLPQLIVAAYYGTLVRIKFEKEEDNTLETGSVILTQIGQELAPIAGSEPVPDFFDYVLNVWLGRGYTISSPWPKPSAN
jgi:hypothetical protein